MFCGSCGAEINDQAVFCPKCGASTSAKSANASAGPSPAPAATTPDKKVTDFFIWSIVALVLCCNPIAIGAIVFSLQSREKMKANDIEGAKKASKFAMWFIIAAVATSLLTWALAIIFQLIGIACASAY